MVTAFGDEDFVFTHMYGTQVQLCTISMSSYTKSIKYLVIFYSLTDRCI